MPQKLTTCNSCDFCDPEGAHDGCRPVAICRLKAPVVVYLDHGFTGTSWPTVRPNKDWCGHHSKLQNEG